MRWQSNFRSLGSSSRKHTAITSSELAVMERETDCWVQCIFITPQRANPTPNREPRQKKNTSYLSPNSTTDCLSTLPCFSLKEIRIKAYHLSKEQCPSLSLTQVQHNPCTTTVLPAASSCIPKRIIFTSSSLQNILLFFSNVLTKKCKIMHQ